VEISVGNKKHVFVFNTSIGEMTVGTDDLRELSLQSWFTNFLGVNKQEPVQPQPTQQPSAPADAVVYDMEDLRRDVKQMVTSMVSEAVSGLTAERSQPETLPPELPPEEIVKIAAEEMEEEMKQTQEQLDNAPLPPPQQGGRPNIRSDIPGVGQLNFLDVTPDKMTQQLWESLSDEQRMQYGQKYGVATS
jgi:hypothetical protein